MQSVGRAIDDGDRLRILTELTQWASSGNFYALRTRALILLVWGSALRLSEALALDLAQVLEQPHRADLGRLRGTVTVRADQAKGRRQGRHRWNSAGAIVVTQPASRALREYLAEALKREWLKLPAAAGDPLFVTIKGGRTPGAASRTRLGSRAAQRSWADVQRRAGIAEPYRFHDLRHDALTRVGRVANGNVFQVARFGRLRDIRTAQRYVHGSTGEIAELAELAAKRPPPRRGQ